MSLWAIPFLQIFLLFGGEFEVYSAYSSISRSLVPEQIIPSSG
jgi:hypothetical protein